ncbi:MAG: cobalt transporter [Cyanobacteria bacterium SBLK]|nr:cobalt transporter [Cyanobacteria bacterium SBLK]
MKPLSLLSSVLAVSLTIASPAFGHAGHGDEFQATGGVNRVEVKTETDSLLGIQVKPIQTTVPGTSNVLIPVTALVDDNGRQLVFVQYENFYEPVDVTTGATQGELIEVTQGLSIGEKLVAQGSLSLYAESRKTKTAGDEPSPEIASSEPSPAVTSDGAHPRADAEGVPHSHDNAGNMVKIERSNGALTMIVGAIGGGVALVIGLFAFLGGGKKKNLFSDD